MARFVFAFCAGVWILAIFENHLFQIPRAWAGVPWLMFFVLQAFVFAIVTSPPASRMAVCFAFVVAIALCISTWATGSARFAQSQILASAKYIRNDPIVRIERSGSTFVAEAKPLRLPIPMLEKLASIISGEKQ